MFMKFVLYYYEVKQIKTYLQKNVHPCSSNQWIYCMRTCNAESKKSSAKVPILKKTTRLCPLNSSYYTLWWNGSKLTMDHSPTTYQIYNQSQNNKNPYYNFVQDILSHYQVLYMYSVQFSVADFLKRG